MSSTAAVLRRSRFWEYLLALALPMVALCLAFAADGIFPFGQTSVCTADMDLQYVGLFGWLARVLHGEGSILYSMASGYGGNMLALVAYYLSSPLSAFLALFDYTQAAEYLSYATIAKIGLAGLAGYAFLRRRFGAGSVSVAFSIAYALGGYSLGQAGNIMWLDGVLMLPLVALGVHELVTHGRCWPLFLSVAVATFANWYTSYIDCLFAVIYFFVCRVECGRRLRDHFWRDGAPFAITMVLGLGASFVVMLPGLLDLTAGVESDLSFFRLLDPRFGVIPWQLPGYLACGSCGGWEGQVPYIATAGLVVVLAVARFAAPDQREGARKRKVALGAMVALCVAGVLFNNASVVWSAMRYASSFMFRHSYTVTFALVICGREAWNLLREMDPQRRRHLLACCALGVMAVLGTSAALTSAMVGGDLGGLLGKFTAHNKVECASSSTSLVAGAIMLAFAVAAANVCLDGRSRGRSLVGLCCASLVIVGAVFGESYINAQVAFSSRGFPADYYGQYWDKLSATHDQAAALVSDPADPAPLVGVVGASYRGDRRDGGPTTTEGLAVGMQSMTEYTSTVHGVTQSLWRHLGYFTSDKAIFGYAYNTPQPAVDPILGVDAVVDRVQGPGLTRVGPSQLEGYDIYSCENRLPFAWGAAEGASGAVTWSEAADGPFTNQLAVLGDATGADVSGVFTPASGAISPADDADGNVRAVTLTTAKDGPLYLYLPAVSHAAQEGHFQTISKVVVDGRVLQSCGFNFDNNVMYAGDYAAGQNVEVRIELGDNFATAVHARRWKEIRHFYETDDANEIAYAATYDAASATQALAHIDKGVAHDVVVADGAVSMGCSADRDTLVVCSLGYDKGWSATVDGVQAEVVPAYEGLCAVRIPAGDHEVRLEYHNPGLAAGAVASGVCIAAFFAWRLVVGRMRARKA